ncbi:hypothetical protein O3G_MSEX001490, partial [Manduca sexta]
MYKVLIMFIKSLLFY